jgi:hypothetical protein
MLYNVNRKGTGVRHCEPHALNIKKYNFKVLGGALKTSSCLHILLLNCVHICILLSHMIHFY